MSSKFQKAVNWFFGFKEAAPKPFDVEAFYNHMNESLVQKVTAKNLKFDLQQAMSLRKYGMENGGFTVGSLLTAKFTQAVKSKKEYFDLSNQLKYSNYLVPAILDTMTTDVLNAKPNGKIVNVTSKKPDIKKRLDEFQKAINIDQMFRDITPHLIDYGEYFMRIRGNPEQGMLGIQDNVDLLNTVALYDGGKLQNFLIQKNADEYKICKPNAFAHFVVGHNKLRIATNDYLSGSQGFSTQGTDISSLTDEERDNLPDYLRIGCPLFLNIVEKIRELILLEKMAPAIKLNEMSQSHVIAMKIPSGTPNEEIIESLARYENFLNTPIGLDLTQNTFAVADIMAVLGRIRVIPYLEDGKGELQNLDIRSQSSIEDILKFIDDYRRVICSSAGLPYSSIFGAKELSGAKTNELRMSSRYVRRLAAIQEALINGLTHMLEVYLINLGIMPGEGDIEISFTEALTDISALEKLELKDAEQAILMSNIELINAMNENELMGAMFDPIKLSDYIRKTYSIVFDGIDVFKSEAAIALEIKRLDLEKKIAQVQQKQAELTPQPAQGFQSGIRDTVKDPTNPNAFRGSGTGDKSGDNLQEPEQPKDPKDQDEQDKH